MELQAGHQPCVQKLNQLLPPVPGGELLRPRAIQYRHVPQAGEVVPPLQ